MRNIKEINSKVMWKTSPLNAAGIRTAFVNLPSGVRASIIVGFNESGWEHVSMELYARRLPTWEEMCFIKNIFWEDEEEVIQIHPKKSEYVNMTEALHLWRPVNGDWSILNDEKGKEGDKQ